MSSEPPTDSQEDIPHWRLPRPARLALALAAGTGLLALVLLAVQPLLPPPPVGAPVDHSVAVGRSTSLQGITMTLDRSYADATLTVITYHVPQTNAHPLLPAAPLLIDAQGHRYAEIGSSYVARSGGTGIFTPLPPEELGAPQTLTFLVQHMWLVDPTGPSTGVTMLDGPWQISFSLTLVAGTSVALHTAPITHGGLTIHPVRLDLAPAGGGLDVATGGARVVVRLSGLAPSMPLSDLPSFGTAFSLDGGYSASGGGGTLLLVLLPNGQRLVPGFVHQLGQTVPTTPAEWLAMQAQTVGPSGTADLEALFYTPISPGASVTLSVDHVAAQIAGTAKPAQIDGPWEFRLLPST